MKQQGLLCCHSICCETRNYSSNQYPFTPQTDKVCIHSKMLYTAYCLVNTSSRNKESAKQLVLLLVIIICMIQYKCAHSIPLQLASTSKSGLRILRINCVCIKMTMSVKYHDKQIITFILYKAGSCIGTWGMLKDLYH
jgi:hypothetical protein